MENKTFKDYELLVKERNNLGKELKERFFVVKYVDKNEIGFLLNNIDLFVGRAGANTVYEMGILKIPSILIPIPWVTNNEQEENAKILKDLGLAEIIREGELTAEFLIFKMKDFYKKEKSFDNEKVSNSFPIYATSTIMKNIGI